MAVKDWLTSDNLNQLHSSSNDPQRKEFLAEYLSFMGSRGTPVNRVPVMARHPLDLHKLYRIVESYGGFRQVVKKRKWSTVVRDLNLPSTITSAAFTLRTQYVKYLYPFECYKRANGLLDGPDGREGSMETSSSDENNMQSSESCKLKDEAVSPDCCHSVSSGVSGQDSSFNCESDVTSSVATHEQKRENSPLIRDEAKPCQQKMFKIDQAVETEDSTNKKICRCCGKDLESQNRNAKLRGIGMPPAKSLEDAGVQGPSPPYPALIRIALPPRNSASVITQAKNMEGSNLQEGSKAEISSSISENAVASGSLRILDVNTKSKSPTTDIREDSRRSEQDDVLLPAADSQYSLTSNPCENRDVDSSVEYSESFHYVPTSKSDIRDILTQKRGTNTELLRPPGKQLFQIQKSTSLWLPIESSPKDSQAGREQTVSAFKHYIPEKTDCLSHEIESNRIVERNNSVIVRSPVYGDMDHFVRDQKNFLAASKTLMSATSHNGYAPRSAGVDCSDGNPYSGSTVRHLHGGRRSTQENPPAGFMFRIHEQNDQLIFVTVDMGGKRYEGPLFAGSGSKKS